ncbi:MAG: malonate decarboxylase subunit alpha [Clostridiales bacterium]|nr:malonate decarboxylase subunit alpha [Clostridiales bacterium]MDY5514717.1 malonate decarboxylase subunit alpha [Candidatus Ventricola sp.]
MYRILIADEAISLIRDGDCICVNSFVGIENPVELHEALNRRYEQTHFPKHLTIVSSAGFGVWDENRNAEGYIRAGAVDRLICGHFGAMPSTKKIILENHFEAYNLPLGCISHAIRAQAGGIPGALSKVGLDIFVDPRREGPGINQISTDSSFVKVVEVDGEEFLYYKLPKITATLIKGTAADRKGNISFDDMYMSGDALSICQAVKSNNGIVIVQVDRIVDMPTRPRNTIIPGCLVDAIVVVEPEKRDDALQALTGSFEIPFEHWHEWTEKLDAATAEHRRESVASSIIGRRAAQELRKEDIVNIGIGIPETISRFAKQNGMLDHITLTVESGGIGGFANITAKTPIVVFCLTFNTKGLEVQEQDGNVTIVRNGTIPKFVNDVRSISFSARKAIANGQKVLYVTERCVFILTARGLKLLEVYPGVNVQKDIFALLPFGVEA